jgi:hypothetical protein
MAKSKQDFLALIACGAWYVIQKEDDWNREDIAIRREDGLPVAIPNYPYRDNQMPAYIFDELLKERIIEETGKNKCGGTIFRMASKRIKPEPRAA